MEVRCSAEPAVTCCPLLEVVASGAAAEDQALYLGQYRLRFQQQNGRPVWEKPGPEPLFVYFFSSGQEAGVSLWVVGPRPQSRVL